MSSSRSTRFVDLCSRGETLPEEIDDYVAAWHAKPGRESLRTYLGMTRAEYETWVAEPDSLPSIVKAHRDGSGPRRANRSTRGPRKVARSGKKPAARPVAQRVGGNAK